MSLTAGIAGLVLLLLNGFFVAAEFALVGSRRTRLEELAAAGNRRASLALNATADLGFQLAGAQLGITMASLGLGYVAEPAVVAGLENLIGPLELPASASHTIAAVLGLGIVVFLHLVVGEMVPKGIALSHPERLLLALVRPNSAYLAVFGPLIRLLNAMANVLTRVVFRVRPRNDVDAVHTADELARMLAESRDEGLIEADDHDLFAGVLDFGGRTAASVMVPVEELSAIGTTATLAELEATVVRTGHSRVLVHGPAGIDDVLGFVHSKDLLRLDPASFGRPVPARLVRRMPVVPPERSLEALLRTMRQTRTHLALVQDRDGRTRGILSLEDLLEELVGDIFDESDLPDPSDRGGSGTTRL